MNIKQQSLFFLLVNLINAQEVSDSKSGSLYISPIAVESIVSEKSHSACKNGVYSIQIDNSKKYAVRKDSSIVIANIDLNKIHNLRIRRDDKIIESFHFSFEKEQSTELCLWLNDLYCTWSLWPLKDAKHLCNCRPAG